MEKDSRAGETVAPSKDVLQYGGQAVIEGVMMRSKHYFAVACRRPDGRIVVQREAVDRGIISKLKWLNKPFLRGTLALVDAMALGSKALSFAANVQLRAEAEIAAAKTARGDMSVGNLPDPPAPSQAPTRSPFPTGEAMLPNPPAPFPAGEGGGETRTADFLPEREREVLAEISNAAGLATGPAVASVAPMPKSGRINDIAVGGALGFTLVAVIIFRSIPTLLTEFVSKHWALHASNLVLNAFDGLIRMGLFFGYILAISFMPQIREVFKYHGAEHKAINTLEAGLPLTRANALAASRIHPRCGTSFLFVVFFVDLLVCLFLPRPVWYLRILLHLAMLPPVAGLAYEVIKFAGRYRRNLFVMAAFAPGMWSQYLTTREPEPRQIEVALAALYSVLQAEGHETPQAEAALKNDPLENEPALA